jgi:hypothetical protein
MFGAFLENEIGHSGGAKLAEPFPAPSLGSASFALPTVVDLAVDGSTFGNDRLTDRTKSSGGQNIKFSLSRADTRETRKGNVK